MKKLDLKTKVPIFSWVPNELSEDELTMLTNMGNLPSIYPHISLMADAHLGKGSMVGAVIPAQGMVIPAAVGVDIGCGMHAIKLNCKSQALEGKISKIRTAIEAAVPVGFASHAEPVSFPQFSSPMSSFKALKADVKDLEGRAAKQLGTLGGGNHFIEVSLDTKDNVWIVLHSGSRNIGKEIAERHIAVAKAQDSMKSLPDPDLSYFLAGTKEFREYWTDLTWAQNYAFINRIYMKRLILTAIREILKEEETSVVSEVKCHHNYVSQEATPYTDAYVIRKGAIAVYPGTWGIVPGSMGTSTYIVVGRENQPDEALFSCSHGAGRLFSRGAAKRQFTIADLEKQTEGIDCRKDADVLDEIPSAYKNIHEVMAQQVKLVDIVDELHQVICIKG
jgi:tRNA-splicing ligase RtcB